MHALQALGQLCLANVRRMRALRQLKLLPVLCFWALKAQYRLEGAQQDSIYFHPATTHSSLHCQRIPGGVVSNVPITLWCPGEQCVSWGALVGTSCFHRSHLWQALRVPCSLAKLDGKQGMASSVLHMAFTRHRYQELLYCVAANHCRLICCMDARFRQFLSKSGGLSHLRWVLGLKGDVARASFCCGRGSGDIHTSSLVLWC